ncbi:hypothetical protein LCGC14_0943370 [marine sediment metagenome]|uniref:Methyltransferase type 11 domain-containing protein n=1 Tax=marine sediment metagenome TaxID=412755 RepID=A0A0F9NP39_9ZZZZ
MKSYSQYNEDNLILKYLPKNPKKQYVDIGAGHPTLFSNTYSFYKQGWRGLLIEPNSKYSDLITCQRPKDSFLEVAITDYTGKLDMYKTVASNSYIVNYYKERHSDEKFTTKCMTMNDLLNNYPGYREPDFASIDIESSEEKLLSQCDFEIFKPHVLLIEYWCRGVNKLGETVSRMDYRPIWEHYLIPYYEFKEKTQGNSIYVRRDNLKLHIACGDVHLNGYVNIDTQGLIASNLGDYNPNKTTLEDYFKYPFGSPRREVIIDKRMDILQPWDFKDDSADEVVMISAIEHFTKTQGKFIVSEIKRVLKSGSRLVIDFPDLKKDIDLYYDKNPEFLMELVYCNQKDEYSVHHWGYTKQTIIKLLGEGWETIEFKSIVKHNYPMVGIIATKK